ncbi:MAG: energy-coupling factor ABC transporter ATP-binding protein [Candidatus Omnitrophica bacterium]|nr:energy-coupling factor ABC transporter ATP-binding protein [Candidatus Omnitrophota bacterium]
MNDRIFKLTDVQYSYLGKYPALRDINMTIRKGEQVALIGSNGTGKSTLLHILDGLIFPDRGEVIALGQTLNEDYLSDEKNAHLFRSKVGLVFQNADIQLFCPSVKEDIVFGPLQLGFNDKIIADRLAQVLEILEIGHLLERIPHQLSIGEKRKVAIASVLAIDPEIIIFDEPTAGLDPLTVRHIVDFIVKAKQKGKTIITATHDLHIVGEIADTVYLFGKDKRIIKQGPAEKILEDKILLQENNLIHIHGHSHTGFTHAHPHLPTEKHSN